MAITVVSQGDVTQPQQAVAEAPKAEAQESAALDAENTEASEVSEEQVEAQSDDEQEVVEGSEDKDKPKRDAEWRVKKLLNERKLERQEKEFWKKVALEKEQAAKAKDVPTSKEGSEKPKDGKPVRPKVSEFESNEAYEAAMDAYDDDLESWRDQQRLAKERDEKAKTESQKLDEAYAKRYRDFEKSNPDIGELFEEAVASGLDVSLPLNHLIKKSQMGPQALYHLLKNQDELQRLSSLDAMDAAVEFGLLVSQLKSEKLSQEKDEAKKITKAPKPLSPVGSKGSSVVKNIFDPSISQAEYEKARREMAKRA